MRTGDVTRVAITFIVICLAISLAVISCCPESTSPTPPTTPSQPSQPSPADSIESVHSTVPSHPEGAPLTPLFGDRPVHRLAINRLALAIDKAEVTGASGNIAVDQRGRQLSIRLRDDTSLIIRQVLRCEAKPEIARMAPTGSCNGRYLPLPDTWWVQGAGIVKSPDLGLWWKDMPDFMVPIGIINLPDTLHPGESFSLTICCWKSILQTPTMTLSLVAQDDTETQLGELPTASGFTESRLTVPESTSPGRYWLRVSTNGFSELVELVNVR